MSWRPLSVKSTLIVPQREIQHSRMPFATNSAVGSGTATSSTHRVWWSMSTSIWVCPRDVGFSRPKLSAATISKGVPIGKLSQRHGLGN